jgi:hypothetical protein
LYKREKRRWLEVVLGAAYCSRTLCIVQEGEEVDDRKKEVIYRRTPLHETVKSEYKKRQ